MCGLVSQLAIHCTKDPKCPELQTEARKRLFGKKSSMQDWIDVIMKLRIGDARQHLNPLNKSEIAEKLSISRAFINDYLEIAKKHKLVEVDESGSIKLPKRTELAKQFQRYEEDAFMKDSLISDWVDDMRTRKNGKPIKIWRSQFNGLKNLCNTLKVKPEQLLIDHKTTETIVKNFALELEKGNFETTKFTPNTKKSGTEGTMYRCRMAVRDFCGTHHLTWRRGIGGVMSGKIIGHAKYPDIKLSEEEIQRGTDFIKKEFGEDSDVMRYWLFALDTCARHMAIMKADLEYTAITKNGKQVFIMKVFESKTEHIKGGIWKKWIHNELLQSLIEKQRQRGCSHLWNDKDFKLDKMQITISKQLKQLYIFLNKDKINEGYFMRKPFHTLRHVSAQRLLMKFHWNSALVCKVGGWHTSKELEDSYGEMPEEMILEEMMNYMEKS